MSENSLYNATFTKMLQTIFKVTYLPNFIFIRAKKGVLGVYHSSQLSCIALSADAEKHPLESIDEDTTTRKHRKNAVEKK